MKPPLPRHKPSKSSPSEGFSRADCLAALLGVSLLAVWLGTALAAVSPEVARVTCKSNLKLIGDALSGWAKDHGDRMPWRVPMREGGFYDFPANGNAWIHFTALSNHLASPNMLNCPADKAKVATSWSVNPEGGYLHADYRGNALSYFVGIDAQANAPKSFLSGDANLNPTLTAQMCDEANVNVAAGFRASDPEFGWKASIHGDPGHILLQSGAVEAMTTSVLRQALPKTGAIHPDNHVLLP